KANNQEGIVAWSPQELAVTTIKNLHYRAKCLMMSEGNIGGHPSHMYWKLDDNNLFAKAYHLHPLLFWPEKHGVYPTISADGKDFLERAYTNFSKWEVIQDCNQISLFEVSSNTQFSEDRAYPTEFFSLKCWLKRNTSKAHQFFYKHDIILGDGEEKPEWKEKIKAAHGLINRLHASNPFGRKAFRFRIPNFRPIFSFYRILIRQVLSGRKRLTFRKVFHHFYFLIRYRSPPYHTVDFFRESKQATKDVKSNG
ncbi:MAG: hypothetical protein KDK64_06025, partial [Chlamydiia bacterium]|nr:hypothetical protein [Chlamydiia bacterium]